MQRDDKFAAKWRMVLDSHFLEHLTRDTDVAKIHSAGPLRQREGEAERQGPLGFNRLALSAAGRIQTEHRCPVLVGPVCSRLVPRLIHQECVLMAVEAVNDEVHRGVREVCGGREEKCISKIKTSVAQTAKRTFAKGISSPLILATCLPPVLLKSVTSLVTASSILTKLGRNKMTSTS